MVVFDLVLFDVFGCFSVFSCFSFVVLFGFFSYPTCLPQVRWNLGNFGLRDLCLYLSCYFVMRDDVPPLSSCLFLSETILLPVNVFLGRRTQNAPHYLS